MTKERLAPLTGVAFVILLIVAFAIGGEPPSADDDVQEIVDHYVDNETSIMIASFVGVAGMVFLIFFANHLRRLFSAGRDTAVSATVLVGAAIIAVGFAIDTTILIALASAAEDIEPTAVQALQALWDNDFVPIALGSLVFLISVGIATLQTGALPKGFGWVALALAVLGFTPIGWIAFLGAGIWILVVSILLAVRAGRPAEPATTAT